ncbi:hypothetical protein VN12_12455 [Pirellula sp. SH-Sr6A]|uniref:hypothetical protein n=1 Tax=Pirellula sp. SH-Sr6A TaxID=1632865 RepID=UPI00078C93C6|nr:hypothetical protein [Pirellula sp. SH-Sr6A]AMV32931.1 hypothetical protein VN12_12455 [Pirellula sp. SH-Sr6A]
MKWRMNLPKPAAACLFAVWVSSAACGADKWTDSSGTKTLEAEFVQLEGIQLTLKKGDGAEVVIPLYKLDDASRLQARKMAKAKLASVASAGEGAKPEFLATPLHLSDTPVEFPKESNIQQFLDIVGQEYEAKNYMVSWDGLPATFQKDLETLVKTAVGLIDPATVKELGKTSKSLITTLRTKKEWLLASKELELDEETLERVQRLYDPIVDLLETILPNDAWDVSAIQNGKLRDLIKLSVEQISPKVERVLKEIPEVEQLQFSMSDYIKGVQSKQRTPTEAEVTVAAFGMPPRTTLWVRLDGKWVDQNSVQQAKQLPVQIQALAKQDKKVINRQILQASAAAALTIGILAEAESQSDVDDCLRDLKSLVLQGMGAMQALQGAGMGGPTGGPPQFGANGSNRPGAPAGVGAAGPGSNSGSGGGGRPPRPGVMQGGGTGAQSGGSSSGDVNSGDVNSGGVNSGDVNSGGANSGGVTSGGP